MKILGKFVIVFVPMINPDGVVIGNSRCSLMGVDLNRRWTNPNKMIHPDIYFLKEQMKQIVDGNTEITIFCDLHGHNKKTNSFFYGNNRAANQGLLSWTKLRLLPKILDQMTSYFSYSDCRFKVDNYKLNTARVVCWNELKINNSFTLEVSMYSMTGADEKQEKFTSNQAQSLAE